MLGISKLLFILFYALISDAIAHPGRVDSLGCHYNRGTGVFHCHKGSPDSPSSAPFLAKLISVGDGDTIRVEKVGPSEMPITIRLSCIDSPEMKQGEAGVKSRASLVSLLQSSPLKVYPSTVDRYGRVIAEVFTENTQNVNLSMVRNGQSFFYRQYSLPCNRDNYSKAESLAKSENLGIWSYFPEIEKPWDFRKK